MVTNLVEHNALGRHPHEPTTVFCTRGQLMRWTGWTTNIIYDLEAAGSIKSRRHTKADGRKGYRQFYVAQIKQLIES